MTEAWKGVDVPTHPQPKGSYWVETVARIRDNKSGEVREYKMDDIISDGDPHPSIYSWEYGNYSCDCNRSLFFQYAAGVSSDAADWDHGCGDGGFSVQVYNPVTGNVFYDEFQKNSAPNYKATTAIRQDGEPS